MGLRQYNQSGSTAGANIEAETGFTDSAYCCEERAYRRCDSPLPLRLILRHRQNMDTPLKSVQCWLVMSLVRKCWQRPVLIFVSWMITETHPCMMRRYGYVDIIKVLLDAGAGLENRRFWPQDTLHMAVGRGHVDAVTMLTIAGADTEAVDGEGMTPRKMHWLWVMSI